VIAEVSLMPPVYLRLGDDEPDDVMMLRPSCRPRTLLEWADRRVTGPGTYLMLVGVLNTMLSLPGMMVWLGLWDARGSPPLRRDEPIILALTGASFITGIVIATGAWRMGKLRGRRHAVIASALALVPWWGVWCLGPPAGIWSLVVLHDPAVRTAFDLAPVWRWGARQPWL
jgi:hypothetical protein